MERVLARELKDSIGKKVFVAGWVRNTRNLGKINFISVFDRSGKIQAVVKDAKLQEDLNKIGLEDVVKLEGTVNEDKRSTSGAELEVSKIMVLSTSDRNLPVDVQGKTKTSFEHRFNHRVLDLRGERGQTIFNVESTICQAFREYLIEQDFIEIHTPKIIATGTEGGANMFPVVYFEREAFLAQSPQFYKQMLVGSGFERVFEVAPVYRAETHDTPFHLNEYVSLDFEMGFINDETDVMKQTQGAIQAALKRVHEENKKELEFLNVDLHEPKNDFPIIHYWDIPKVMKSYGKEFSETEDLSREHEETLCKYAQEKFKCPFIFVANYPAAIRPAYTQPYEEDPKFTRGYDLLYNGLEITTGGQRIHNYELLRKKFAEKGFPLESFDYYFEVFKYGMPPHGGQAIGLERLVMKLLNLDNVREASFFPRDRKRLSP